MHSILCHLCMLSTPYWCLPHARGGVSKWPTTQTAPRRSSPRPWGCFPTSTRPAPVPKVFPTPVGVFPNLHQGWWAWGRLPHARGGVSKPLKPLKPTLRSSPRPWGCFPMAGPSIFTCIVFPTPVGVFPMLGYVIHGFASLPHARGGVSFYKSFSAFEDASSPRPWGCFWGGHNTAPHPPVFPTPVGVFLFISFPTSPNASLPHARGGVSKVRPPSLH